MAPKRVAVIGSGPCGLAAIKTCKEAGFDPICYERNGDPGGLWRYHEEDIEGVASVMKTTIINTSKEMSAFSDFPPPKEYPNFMHNSQMYRYFMMYAEHFDLLRHIRYNLEVVKVEMTGDHDTTGRWIVTVKSSQTGAVTREEFDGVLVCIGHHVYPKIPHFPGQEKFKGVIMHSHSVKSCNQFSDKNVVVVGIGNSGVDAAVDCTFFAKSVYISTRRGTWIFSRVGPNGRPYDMDLNSRKKVLLQSFMSYDRICSDVEEKLNEKFDHEAYKLKPKHRVYSAHPTMNDFLPNCILSGRITVKGNIKNFEENGIVFDGEDEVTEADVVILATGYVIKFPFLENILTIDDNRVLLYKYAIPPILKHPTLAIIGLIQPIGPIFPIGEMQCRWFAQLLLGNAKLPSTEDMLKEIKAKNDANAKRYVNSTRHTIQVDWIPFMDELASIIGAKPNFLKMALTDPKLFSACFNNACLPYHYRLQGPFSWSGARDAILNYEKRVFAGLNSEGKVIPKPKGKGFGKYMLFFIFLSTVFFVKSSFLLNMRKQFHLDEILDDMKIFG